MSLFIVVPNLLRFDVIVGVWLLRKFGQKKFPGIDKAKVKFFGDINGLQGNLLYVGCGGGEFDHPFIADLVMESLEINGNPVLKEVLRSMINSDLGRILKLAHNILLKDPEDIINLISKALEKKYREQSIFFFPNGNTEYDQVHFTEGGKVLNIATVRLNEGEDFFERILPREVSVAIQQKQSGHVLITINPSYKINLGDIVSAIRSEEAIMRHVDLEGIGWDYLSSAPVVQGIKLWFFSPEKQFLLNGSPTTTKIPSTLIKPNRMEELTEWSIDPAYFPNKDCRTQDICVFDAKHTCPCYWCGWPRCRGKRYERKIGLNGGFIPTDDPRIRALASF
ncbi:MAG: hypothetical protein WC297_02640 [Candidatus Paceibacterota bacterium]|jgi:hypothetical protein